MTGVKLCKPRKLSEIPVSWWLGIMDGQVWRVDAETIPFGSGLPMADRFADAYRWRARAIHLKASVYVDTDYMSAGVAYVTASPTRPERFYPGLTIALDAPPVPLVPAFKIMLRNRDYGYLLKTVQPWVEMVEEYRQSLDREP